MPPTRPILRYHGSKWNIADWIIALMPKHRVYVEAFGGGASVLMRKPRLAAEIYNDLDGRVVNVFRVMQDPAKAEVLRHRLDLTPYARSEFELCYQPAQNDIESAARTIMLSQMGFGGDSIGRSCRTGFRSKLSGSGFAPSMSWATWPREIPAFLERLRGVVIEQREAREVIRRLDSSDTLHYVDPPYVTSTRSSLQGRRGPTHGYRHELTDEEHVELAATLRSLQGMVMLSGYRCTLYDDLYAGWQRVERGAWADGAKRRTECLWLNDAAAVRSMEQGTLVALRGVA